MNITSLYQHSWFANLAYVDFRDITDSTATIADARNERRLPESLGSLVLNPLAWGIFHAQPNTPSGFAATVFANGAEKVLAIRGTEADSSVDLLQADLTEIGLLGIAISQTVDLYNYVQRLSAPAGATGVLQVTLHADVARPRAEHVSDGHGIAPVHYWLEPRYTGTGLGVLSAGDRVTVTGHSLGGHLAAVALRLFPGVFAEAVTFNAAGFDPHRTSVMMTDELLSLFGPFLPDPPADSFAAVAARIHTIESESSAPGDDLSLVSSLVTGLPPSPEKLVATEVNSHSMDQLMDSLAVQSLFASLNPSLSLVDSGRLYRAASNQPELTDERLVQPLSRLLLGDASPVASGAASVNRIDPAPFESRISLHDRVVAIRAALEDFTGLALTPLTHGRAGDLLARAESDIGVRYALATLQPFALTGNSQLYAGPNSNGAYDLHEPDSRQGELTREYLADRSRMLQQAMARNGSDSVTVADGPYRNEVYVDFDSDVRFATADVAYTGPALPQQGRRLLFDGDGARTLEGSVGDDRLYAGGGDDTLRGGPGMDRLEGGPGADTYRYDRGDGLDVVVDTDGLGRVVYDGVQIELARRAAEGIYRTAAGVTLALDHDAVSPSGTLVVENGLRIEGFRDGDLGIVLDDTPQAPRPYDHALTGTQGVDVLSFETLERRLNTADYRMPMTVAMHTDGGEGNDWLVTVDGEDTVLGSGGDDYIISGTGDDRVDGGDGNDLVFSGPGADCVDGGSGNDLLAGNQYLLYDTTGTAADDERAWRDLGGRFGWQQTGLTLTDEGLLDVGWRFLVPSEPFSGPSTAAGLTFSYDPVSSQIRYYDGSGATRQVLVQTAIISPWPDDQPKLFSGGAGDDLLAGAAGNDSLSGGEGNDWLAGNDGVDVLVGGAGADFLIGGRGDDSLHGGTGADTLVGEDGADVLFGDDGNDRLFGDSEYRPATTAGADSLYGGAGDDELVGHGGDDHLYGESGNDTLFGATGNDWLEGGAGDDLLQGGEGNDWLDGGSANDALHGEAGDDVLVGDYGSDYLRGGAGNDVVSGGPGSDDVSGEAGDDRYLFRVGDGFDRLTDVQGRNRLELGSGLMPEDLTLLRLTDGSTLFDCGNGDGLRVDAATLDCMETIAFATGPTLTVDELIARRLVSPLQAYGSDGGDLLQGGQGDDTLLGEEGDDHIAGSGGDDHVDGGGGSDSLIGGVGNDTLHGGAGDDRLAGGSGNDALAGGSGADTYVFASGDGRDLIREQGGGAGIDTLELGPGITFGDLDFRREPNGDLCIGFPEPGDGVRVEGWYLGANNRIERLAFADGDTVDTAFLAGLGIEPIVGSAGDDHLVGSSHDEILLPGAGSDHVDAGGGNDRIEDGGGDDTYVIGYDSGLDTIVDATGNNRLELARGLWAGDLVRERVGDDLLIRPAGAETPGVRLVGYGSSADAWQLVAEDGTVLSLDAIAAATPWALAADPIAQARQDYLDGLQAEFLATRIAQGHVRAGEDSVRRAPVGATLATWRYEEQVLTTDAATGDVSLRTVTSYSGPELVSVRLESGQEIAGSHLQQVTESFVVEPVAVEGAVSAQRPWQDTLSQDLTQIGFTPTRTHTRQLAPSGSTSVVEGANVRFEQRATLVSVTETTGTLGAGGDTLLPLREWSLQTVVEDLVGGAGDDCIVTGRGWQSVLEGGTSNDLLRAQGIGGYSPTGVFLSGGDGEDVLSGGGGGDRLAGGPGGDYLDGGAGADRYLMDVSQPGIDLLWDAAQIHVCPETGWSEYKAWYYENAGIDTTDLYGQIFHGPAVPTVPAIDATDYAALAGVYAAGLVDIDSLELSAGVGVADLTLSWGYHWSLEGNAPTQATLNLTWGDASGVRIVMPPTPVETWNFTEWVQPGWFQVEEGLGVGIERLRLADGTELDMAGLVALAPVGLLHPAVELERVDGTDGADSLSAAAPATWLTGAAGDDQLTGGAQPDVLVGGAGADRLVGGLGGDLYVFHAGDGHDHIVETASGAGDLDVIQLDEGPDVLTTEVLRNGHDLELWFGAGEGITIEGWYAYPAARVEQVVFAEGWVWDLHELERRAVVVNLPPTGQEPPAATATSGEAFVLPLPEGTFNDPDGDTLSLTATQPDGSALPSWLAFDAANATLAGTPPAGTGGDYLVALTATDPGGAAAEVVLSLRVQEGAPDPLQGNDELTGTDAADRLDGGPGDDVLHGSGGDDTLVGGPGADALHGGPGSDRLDGGPGDDALLGGWGSDTYAYRPGDGHDTILDTGPAWQIDRLVLGEGIDAADVALRRDGRDLVLDIAGTDGGITISNWFGAPWRRIERIETASGEVLLSTGVDRLVSAIAGFRASGTAEWAPTGAEPSPLAALLAAAWQREAA